MDNKVVSEILQTFSTHQRAFTIEEALAFADSDCDITAEDLNTALMNSPQFMCLGRADPAAAILIAKKSVIQWLINLNTRLAIAGQCRLNKRKLSLLMDSLGIGCDMDVALEAIVRFGQQFGLVAPAWTQNQYVFPLAHLMSFVSTSAAKVATSLITDVLSRTGTNLSFEDDPRQMVMASLSKFESRVAQVVQSREGLLGNETMTLEEIGKRLGVTRERVRQIEMKFWEARKRGIGRPPFRPFLAALLRHLIVAQQGSLIVELNSDDTAYIKFTCKCAGVPVAELKDIGMLIIGASSDNLEQILSIKEISQNTNITAIGNHLESAKWVCLLARDVQLVAERLSSFTLKRLNKAQKVYLVLKKIGKPAHYSQISEVYNDIFPDEESNDHNIHAILDREQHGVVWVGIRGTFALKEWGYERPSEGLFESVADIVSRKFQETEKPVHFSMISAEIGKYRQLVKPASLAFATFFNPRLRCVSKDLYVPAQLAAESTEEPTVDELDERLREWEQKNKDIGCQTDN